MYLVQKSYSIKEIEIQLIDFKKFGIVIQVRECNSIQCVQWWTRTFLFQKKPLFFQKEEKREITTGNQAILWSKFFRSRFVRSRFVQSRLD